MQMMSGLQRESLRALTVMGWLIFLFLVHRGLSFSLLNPEEGMKGLRLLDTFFIGALSDIWVAGICGLWLFLMSVLTIRIPKLQRTFAVGLTSLVATLLFFHQAYVEFFGIQAMPFHFRYLFDKEFLNANGLSLPSYAQCGQLFAGVLAVTAVVRLRTSQKAPATRIPGAVFLGVIILCIGAHALNIRMRVQHFVPDPLQLNVFERLYKMSARQVSLPRLSEEQKAFAGKSTDAEASGVSGEGLASVVLWKASEARLAKLALGIKAGFQAAQKAGRRPLVLVVLLESARPSETSAFLDHEKPAPVRLTPNFDELAARGFLFRDAYSAGTVTRAGQEAVWCGTLSSMYSSLMRERQDLSWDCLPRRLSGVAESFWFHGGDANFDGQRSFWQKQGVNHILTRSDFAAQDSGTGWGIGDLSLFARSVESIRELKASTDRKALLGQILTVTNHIPWTLPADVPADLAGKMDRQLHPSAQASMYVDYAIGTFVAQMKAKKVWDDAIVLFVSDHGSKVPPTYDLYPADQFRRQRLMTHIDLLVSGGITEAAVSNARGSARWPFPVSQAAVAPFIAWLFDEDGPYFSEPLFTEQPRSPVFSQLENGFFFPDRPAWFDRDDLSSIEWAKLAKDDKKAYSYLISFLTFMEKPKSF